MTIFNRFPTIKENTNQCEQQMMLEGTSGSTLLNTESPLLGSTLSELSSANPSLVGPQCRYQNIGKVAKQNPEVEVEMTTPVTKFQNTL